MKGLMTLLTLGSVAAVAIPLALLLEWWSVRGLLALLAGPGRSGKTPERRKRCCF